MATTIEEFVARIGWEVDTEELENFEKQVEGTKKVVIGVTKALTAAAGAMTAWLGITTRQTAVAASNAQAVGLSIENYQALKGVLRDLGFEGENVIDLVEEMNNKLGEKKGLGEMTAVDEALQQLNIDFAELKDLAPEEQFIRILDAAKQLEDQQVSVSAIDMIFGGEGNKVMGLLRTFTGSLVLLLDKYKQLNFLNEEGAAGAQKFDRAVSKLALVVGSLASQLAGLVGEALEPYLDTLQKMVVENKELIKLKMAEWVQGIIRFFKTFWKWLTRIATLVSTTVKALGGLENALELVGVAIAGLVTSKALLALGSLIKMYKAGTLWAGLMSAATLLIPLAFAALAAIIILLIEDIKTSLQGGTSVFDEWANAIGEWAFNVVEDIKVAFGELKKFLFGVIDEGGIVIEKIVKWFEGLPDKITAALDRAKAAIGSFVSGPLDSVKGFFGFDGSAPASRGGVPAPSGAAAAAGSMATTYNKTSNRQGGTTQVNAPITINPSQGMDEKQIGEIAAQRLRQETAKAARNNSGGFDY